MPPTKYRSFSIVFHNVSEDCKSGVQNQFKDSSKLLVALEPYPEQEGFHIHVFVTYPNARAHKAILKMCQQFSANIVVPCPEGETRSWGRVQVDQMRGSFAQATAYLTVPKKDKICDENLISEDPQKNKKLKDVFDEFMRLGDYLSQVMFFPDTGKFQTIENYIHDPKSSPADDYKMAFERYNYLANKYT